MTKKGRKRRKRINKLLIILPILFIFLTSFLFLSNKNLDHKDFVKMGKVEVKYLNNSAAVILENGCYKFAFYTSKEQGQNIELALKNIKLERPLTHDLIVSIFEKFNLKVKELRITKLEGNIYYADLVFDDFLNYKKIDLRPSDGVAIALRAKIPIFVRKNLARNTCLEKIL